jgi:DNA-binding GntR family transcriptional regulator
MLIIPKDATVGDNIFLRVRTDIIFGQLRPGERLRLERLKERYGAGISTLREILSRLASEGFVVAEGQRGFQVAPVSFEDLQEIADLRTLLECHAMRLSFAAGDMDWEGQVVAAHYKLKQMENRIIAGDHSFLEAWKQYDWGFHQALIKACNSEQLLQVHGIVFDKYLRYQMLALNFRGEVAAREHQMLLDAALERDAAKAQTILRAHINGGVEYSRSAVELQQKISASQDDAG